MEKLKQLEQNVIQWADDRGFFGKGGATLFGQYLKLREEFGELSGNFAKGRCMKDDIGDVAVVSIILNRLSGGDIILSKDIVQKVNDVKLTVNNKQEAYLFLDYSLHFIMVFSDLMTTKVPTSCFRNSIGTLMVFSEFNGFNFTECLEHAYNEIKDRKGKWINNVFVNESDL